MSVTLVRYDAMCRAIAEAHAVALDMPQKPRE
jgi:hypothetical protein